VGRSLPASSQHRSARQPGQTTSTTGSGRTITRAASTISDPLASTAPRTRRQPRQGQCAGLAIVSFPFSARPDPPSPASQCRLP
jgi:hypothetical protein